VSATLDFGFVERRLGLEHARRFDAGSPFDFRSQTLLYVPRRVAEPREGALADEVEALCRLSRGRALVLTTSYRMLDELATRLRVRLPYEVLVQGEAPRERLLEAFRADVHSVLLATQSFWQGVDIRGEACSCVIIDRLPFAVPSDPLVAGRCEQIVRDGGSAFDDYALPQAALMLRQGFGRLLRSHDDHGVVAVLDGRLNTARYAEPLLAALAPVPRVHEIADVEAFFARSVELAT
jgi:ATP-dependent DNA helicase DinG